MNSTVMETLSEMAKLTALSGQVCDAQLKNLKNFPFYYFEGLTEVKIEYDLMPQKSIADEPTYSNSTVSYFLTLDESLNHSLENRFTAIEKSVRTLFWSDCVVEVYFNGSIKYKSQRNK